VTGFVFTMLTPSPIPERMQMWVEPVISGLGWALIVGGGAMRLWASLYIGGWKSERLMTEGPYSICRNPLYLGSVTTGAGFALLLNSGVLLVAVGAVALVYTLYLVPHEERRLADRFGERYQHYRQQTPMLWPRWRGFRTQPVIQVHLRSLAREFWRVIVWGLVAVGAELFADECGEIRTDDGDVAAVCPGVERNSVLPFDRVDRFPRNERQVAPLAAEMTVAAESRLCDRLGTVDTLRLAAVLADDVNPFD